MNGKIWVETGANGLGSVFHFTARFDVQKNYVLVTPSRYPDLTKALAALPG
jgi:hypothetical protein